MAIDVIRSVLVVNTVPTVGLSFDSADVVIAEPNPNNISVIVNNALFFFKHLYFF